MEIKVYKFGGASVKNAVAVQNIAKIISIPKNRKLIIILSAMGKTTNDLEIVLDNYFYQKVGLSDAFNKVKDFHLDIAKMLFQGEVKEIEASLNLIFNNLEKDLEDKITGDYDFYYDKIVCYGELLSSKIVHLYLKKMGFNIFSDDVRKFIITNDLHREAKVNWNLSEKNIKAKTNDIFNNYDIFLTQGFIASSTIGATTTLGREGSDFTGAIFAFATNAESLTIWKDVQGLQNADPKYFADTKKIDVLSYGETVELAYYGATIIHPKTIKPLQNKGIPLFVKSFLDPENDGTRIHTDMSFDDKFSSYIFKRNQVLISISPRDYSFMEEENFAIIFSALAGFHLKVNMMQNSAISFSICVDKTNGRVEKFIESINNHYKVRYNGNLELLTIRHYSSEIIDKLVGKREILLEQRSRSTIQMVLNEL